MNNTGGGGPAWSAACRLVFSSLCLLGWNLLATCLQSERCRSRECFFSGIFFPWKFKTIPFPPWPTPAFPLLPPTAAQRRPQRVSTTHLSTHCNSRTGFPAPWHPGPRHAALGLGNRSRSTWGGLRSCGERGIRMLRLSSKRKVAVCCARLAGSKTVRLTEGCSRVKGRCHGLRETLVS